MPTRKSYISQAAIFDLIGKPSGYDDLPRMDKHYLRQDATSVYDRAKDSGLDDTTAAHRALERANKAAAYYTAQNIKAARNARCGAKTRRGTACRQSGAALGPSGRCKYHGGRSTGPTTLQGRIKAISSLKQYKTRPDLLAARIEAITAEARA